MEEGEGRAGWLRQQGNGSGKVLSGEVAVGV